VSQIYFLQLLMQLICKQSSQIFHNHITPQHIYITTDKLCLNKVSHMSTHTSGIRLLCPQQGGFHLQVASVHHGRMLRQQRRTPGWHQLAYLNFFICYWLPEFPPSSQPVEAASQLPHASLAKCRFMQVTEQLG
jgi:hypothetical protein